MSLEKNVNWSQFSCERCEYRVGLKVKKEENAKKRLEREGAQTAPPATNLAKWHCIARVAFPSSMKLTMKSELGTNSSLMG